MEAERKFITFWFFISGSDAMAYSIMFLWILLPVTTFVISLLIGRNNYWGKWKWLSAVVFGVMYMLAEYASFSAANMSSTVGKILLPDFAMLPAGAAISLLGLVIGAVIHHFQDSVKNRQ